VIVIARMADESLVQIQSDSVVVQQTVEPAMLQMVNRIGEVQILLHQRKTVACHPIAAEYRPATMAVNLLMAMMQIWMLGAEQQVQT
jgi:hypothetical protein